MSSSAAATTTSTNHAGDSFAIGVLVMLIVSVLQRCVGLVRGLGFARFLTDVELGQWALASSFYVIAVPVAVLGLPGSFGKFVEVYRSRGRLACYFRRVIVASSIGLIVTCATIIVAQKPLSWLVLGEPTSPAVMCWIAITLFFVASYSCVSELVAAFRQVQTVSHMQFTQSVTFAVVGLALVAACHSWWVLLPSFALAHAVGLLPGCWTLYRCHRHEFGFHQTSDSAQESQPSTDSIWMRILPYAASLWTINLLSNLFEMGDRYMLLHLISPDQDVAQATVGQYHCARLLPNLLTSLALMLGGILLPYLSADWEQGNRQQIASRIRQMVQSVCIGFLALSVGAMLIAPLMFDVVFDGKYQLAESVLPLALMQATLVSLFLVSEPYMLCAEKGRQLAMLLVAALGLNLCLNAWWIASWGLSGAVLATSTANFMALMMLFWYMNRAGCRLGWGTICLTIAPLSIAAGPIAATATLALVVAVAGRTDWILSAEDRLQIDRALLPKLQRLGLSPDTLWP